jgi:hypothetical protein
MWIWSISIACGRARRAASFIRLFLGDTFQDISDFFIKGDASLVCQVPYRFWLSLLQSLPPNLGMSRILAKTGLLATVFLMGRDLSTDGTPSGARS